jgi:hypothetical protein
VKLLLATVLVICTAAPAAAQSWATAAAILKKSTVPITYDSDGGCTGFVIHKEKRRVLTAAHCDDAKIYVDGSPAKVIAKDAKKDLMVLEVEDLDDDRPALRLAASGPALGDEVASYGYGYAWDRPMFRVAHISDDETYIPEEGIGGPFYVIDAAFVGGQSGVGFGVGAETIKDRMGKYFEPSK